MLALLFADLDKFKEVNDLHGHQIGDGLLIAVADRLTAMLRPGDTLARLSGDEFVILCEDLVEEADVRPLAARVGAALARPFLVSDSEVNVTASVGIAFAGAGSDVPKQLLRDADLAMYQAKRKGGDGHQVVDLREQDRARERAGLEQDLRGALAAGELRLDYQPVVSTADSRITGVEALLRWAHPSRGTVAPATVIPLAEQLGLIPDIGRWVMEKDLSRPQRLGERLRLRRPHGGGQRLGPHQVMAPGFVATVAAVLLATHTDPGHLTLEVTECVFVEDGERALVVLVGLKELGVMLALDDFGTGYSSLRHLQRFPVDTVKIDQFFVAGVAKGPSSSVIVSAIVDMTHNLGIRWWPRAWRRPTSTRSSKRSRLLPGLLLRPADAGRRDRHVAAARAQER